MDSKGHIAFVLATSLIISCQQEEVAPEKASKLRTSGKTLMMHYMPWYETPEVRGKWGSHWTGHKGEHDPESIGSDGLPNIWSHYHPLIGLYDSTDPDVIECHLLQMKLAGIDGVIADWYGIGNAADYPPIHEATKRLFDAAGRQGMTFAVCYEDRSVGYLEETGKLKPGEITAHLSETFQWMQGEWFSADQYHRLGGRPLVLNFGPMHVRDAKTWSEAMSALSDRPALYSLHHLWKIAGADGGFAWVDTKAWDGEPDEKTLRERLDAENRISSNDPSIFITAAYPGFRDVYEKSHPTLDHRDGATLGESLRAAMSGPSETIQLVTWNDYGEGTMIEPTHEFGYIFLEIVQSERRKELGDDFTYKANDLRLPADLLTIRKNPEIPEEEANRIAAYLVAGDCEKARTALSRITRE